MCIGRMISLERISVSFADEQNTQLSHPDYNPGDVARQLAAASPSLGHIRLDSRRFKITRSLGEPPRLHQVLDLVSGG